MFKRILKAFSIILIAVIAVVFILLLLDRHYCSPSEANLSFEEKTKPVRSYDRHTDSLRHQSLMGEFGKKKNLPKGFELQTLVALSHYPQLKNVDIDFVLTDSKGSLYSQPKLLTVLWPWKKREYVVLIDTIKLVDYVRPTLLENLPYNAQIGVIGHELAHTVSYLDKKATRLFWTAFRYQLFEEYLVKFENATDIRTIDHGLGYQLLAWSEFQHHIKIQEGKGRRYLSPDQIKVAIKDNSLYRP